GTPDLRAHGGDETGVLVAADHPGVLAHDRGQVARVTVGQPRPHGGDERGLGAAGARGRAAPARTRAAVGPRTGRRRVVPRAHVSTRPAPGRCPAVPANAASTRATARRSALPGLGPRPRSTESRTAASS